MRLLKQISLVCAGIVFGAVAANAQDEPQMQGHRGLDLNIELGPDFSLQKGGGTSFAAKLDVGKKFNKNFYFGVGGGIMTGGGSSSYPVFGTLRTYLPSAKTKIIPTAAIRGGYIFNADCPFVSVAPGVLFPISNCIDLSAGVEYTASFMDGATGHGLGVNVGLSLHKSANSVKKTWAQTREHGLQYVIEGGGKLQNDESYGLDILAMYKMNTNLSFGAGIGCGWASYPYEGGDNHWGMFSLEGELADVFVRGKYNLSGNKVSPFVSVDLGTHLLFGDAYEDSTYEPADVNKFMLFVTPAVGVSFQMAGNSWLDVKAGYEISSAAVKKDGGFTSKTSGITFGVSFTHTMNILTNGL